jgi:hypothetical protein
VRDAQAMVARRRRDHCAVRINTLTRVDRSECAAQLEATGDLEALQLGEDGAPVDVDRHGRRGLQVLRNDLACVFELFARGG